MRQRRLSDGIGTQRGLALARHRARFGRHYAGREGRWTERLVTLTMPHSGDVGLDVRRLVAAWRRMEPQWRRHLKKRGATVPQVYVRAIEVANAGHAHLHVWMVGPYVERELLRVWWAMACHAEGATVERELLARVLERARDTRTGDWLAPYVIRTEFGEVIPYAVVDVRGGSASAAGYALKVGGAASYVARGEDYRELSAVHAARVYEALEGVRVVQWARGWAPRRDRSARWALRRIRMVATGDSEDTTKKVENGSCGAPENMLAANCAPVQTGPPFS